jgi:ABC-type lipoprotein export system ATPase subunit
MTLTVAPARELAACEGVWVRHRVGAEEIVALADIELAIEPGESVALRGPSGSGKTTLLHLLGGLLVPSEGNVLWKGQRLSSLDVEARARIRAAGIAYVFQGANLLPTFTALENLAFAAWATSRNAGDRRDPSDLPSPTDLLGLVGLRQKADSLPAELSGGERQRVAIARGLAQSPELLLCDEPTGHLDSDTAIRVLDLIDALHERFGFALVIATHDLGVAARCQREVSLADGRSTGMAA